MSRVLPILFNTEMVKAIFEKVKRKTRRIIKGYIPNNAVWGYTIFTPKATISCRGTFENGYGEKFFKLPCEIEDILYVRETFAKPYSPVSGYAYKADVAGCDLEFHRWKPSIHMPKEAALLCDRPNNKVISHSKGFGFSTHNFTCDKKICTNCTTRIDGFDYCPDCIAKIKSAQKGVEEC